jgi:glycerol-3-phosphate dehydrogenase
VSDLIVIGGGVTGCAVARDAALRGLRVTLIERGQLGAGTSGRFHGMLQSGARYATTDPAYAAQCMRERRILERTASHARADTGGLFVQMTDDPTDFSEMFATACEQADIPCQPLSAAEVTAREPALASVVHGFAVPDAVFRPWEMVPALAEHAGAYGASIRAGETVIGIDSDGSGCEVEIVGGDGGAQCLQTRAVVIAAGPWSAGLAAMAGLVTSLELAKGSMLVVEERVVSSVVNRCRPPGSFDIMVPFGETTIFGTTSEDVDGPDGIGVNGAEEVDLLAQVRAMTGERLDRSQVRVHSYAGVRPLAASAPGDDGAVSRRHVVVARDDAPVVAVVGGSFTTHRAMAEEAVDVACGRLGVTARCTTADTPLPPAQGLYSWSRDAALQPTLSGNALHQAK